MESHWDCNILFLRLGPSSHSSLKPQLLAHISRELFGGEPWDCSYSVLEARPQLPFKPQPSAPKPKYLKNFLVESIGIAAILFLRPGPSFHSSLKPQLPAQISREFFGMFLNVLEFFGMWEISPTNTPLTNYPGQFNDLKSKQQQRSSETNVEGKFQQQSRLNSNSPRIMTTILVVLTLLLQQ